MYTRAVRYAMCIVAQRDKLYSIPFNRYKHEPSALHSLKLIVISKEPVINN